MDSPTVSVSQDLRAQLADAMTPVKVEVRQPNSGFAALDNPDFVPTQDMSSDVAPAGPAAPQAVPPPAKDQLNDDRMAKVLSQAQKVQSDRQQLAQERAQHAADLAELNRYRQLKAIAKDDPVAWAEEGGYKPDEYATTLMEKGSMSPERRKIIEQQRELNDLKSWQQDQVRSQQVQQQQALKSRVDSDMQAFAAENSERYDLVSRTGAYDQVLGKIQEHFLRTQALGEPEILPYDDAFQAVEAELEARYAPVLESPKFRSKLANGTVAASPQTSSSSAAQRKPAGTINRNMKAQSSAPRPLTDHERMTKAGEVLWSQIYGRR